MTVQLLQYLSGLVSFVYFFGGTDYTNSISNLRAIGLFSLTLSQKEMREVG